MVDGFDKLQSFYLQIDETYTDTKIKEIAEANGLYCEEINDSAYHTLDISENKTLGYGPGAELYYEFDCDSINIWLSKNDSESDDNSYAFSKTYTAYDNSIKVKYTFYDKELTVDDGTFDDDKDWDSVEDALKYALK